MNHLLVFFASFAVAPSLLATAVIDACVYPDDAGAATAWAARGGSTPAMMQQADGTAVLTLDCKFTTARAGRGCWDREGAIDLAEAEGLHLNIFCSDSGPISSFMVYLKMGDGWRTHTFFAAPHRRVGDSDDPEIGHAGGRQARWLGRDQLSTARSV